MLCITFGVNLVNEDKFTHNYLIVKNFFINYVTNQIYAVLCNFEFKFLFYVLDDLLEK